MIVDDDDYALPLSEFLPHLDRAALASIGRCSSRISWISRWGACESGRLVIPARFRGARRAHVQRVDNGFEPIFPCEG